MSSVDAIERIAGQLQAATSFAMVFGVLPSGDIAAKKGALRQQFAYLAHMVHPDHAPKGSEKRAAEAFRVLNEFRRAAEVAVDTGAYDQPFLPGKVFGDDGTSAKGVEIQSLKGIYRLSDEPFRFGDFSVLYRGHFVNGSAGGEVIVKIASDPRNNTWLEREARILGRFHGATEASRFARVKKYVPEILDTFLVPGKDGKRFRAIILRQVPDLVSVEQIIEAYPRGLDPQDAAWVCRRIIAQTLAASMAAVVHGALVPAHVLVDPFKHEPFHIGWAHAVDDPTGAGGRVTHVIDRWREFYPPEVFTRNTFDHRSDVFMAGKTMMKLLGGDAKSNTLPSSVPNAMARVVLRCVEASPARRFQDGKQALDEFTRVVRSLWGKVYRLLTMPVH